ncbi:MAG: YceI family protein [Myxococcota bacterium]|jgi:polyisoprenoid-binding protein YceI
MKKLLLAVALLTSPFAFASTWEIDSAHAAANFSVRHMMISNVQGTLGKVTGKVMLDDADVTRSAVEASIDVKGINTREPKRDDHLRSKDFFDVEKFPAITFKSTKIEKAGDKLKVTGDLTIHGVTKPVTLDAVVTNEVKNPFTKAVTRGVSATGKLNRKDFGLTWNVALEAGGLMVGEEVDLAIEAELVKQDGGAPAAAPAKKK